MDNQNLSDWPHQGHISCVLHCQKIQTEVVDSKLALPLKQSKNSKMTKVRTYIIHTKLLWVNTKAQTNSVD